MIILFFGDSVRSLFPSRPQCAILGTGILGQIASFERRLRGAAQTPFALPYPFRTWTGSRTWAERDKREVRKKAYLGGIRPSYSWILAYAELSTERKKHVGKHLFPSWHHFKVGSYFVPTTFVSWSHLEAFGLLSYDCCVVAFRYRISRLNTFVRALFVVKRGRSLPNDIITPSVRADSSPFFCFSHFSLSSFWTSRGHRCRPFSPPVLAFNFYRA